MAIRQLKKSWWVDFQFDGRRYRKRSPENTRQGARAYELLLRQRITRGEKIDGLAPENDISFEKFAWEWFQEYAVPNNRFSEQRIKRYTLKSALIPFFGRMRISEIKTYHIEQYKARKVKDGLSNKTIKNHLTVLSKCINSAYSWFEFASKPPDIPWPKCSPPDTDYLSPDECELLLSQASGVIREMILMALRTGMRQGELKGLQWSSVDWSNRMVIVKNSYCDREKTIGPPKNNRARSIPIDADLYEILYRKRNATGYVFSNTKGQPFNHSSLTYHLEALCKRAGLRRITWHTFRHTFASHLAMKGVPLNIVQALLGHSTIIMTMRYAHVAPSTLRSAIELLSPGRFITGDFGQPAVNQWTADQRRRMEVSEGPVRKAA